MHAENHECTLSTEHQITVRSETVQMQAVLLKGPILYTNTFIYYLVLLTPDSVPLQMLTLFTIALELNIIQSNQAENSWK